MKFKKFVVPILFSFVICTVSYAQGKLDVEANTSKMSKGEHAGYMVDIPNASVGKVESLWEDVLKKGNSKVERSNGEIYTLDGKFEAFGKDRINVYGRVMETVEGTRLIAFFEEDSTFISDDSPMGKRSAAKVFVSDFAMQVQKEMLNAKLTEEQNKLDDLKSDMKDLVKEEDKLHKRLAAKKAEFEGQEHDVSINKEKRMSTGAALESDKKNLDKASKKLYRQMAKIESDIRSLEREISENEIKRERLDAQIKDQEEVVRSMKTNM